VRHIHYLHGFAASARSTKAARFAERLNPAGVVIRCLDYNEPDFATLTVSRMLEQLEADMATLPPGPVALIGSSLGGFVAFHAAVRQARRAAAGAQSPTPIDRLVLLAPAFEFGRSSFGAVDAEGIKRWRQTGWLEVYHWAEDAPRAVHFGLYEDAQLYDSFAERVSVPTLVFQGLRDAAVDPAMVQRFVARQPHMSIRIVDDDHLLMGSIDMIVRETAAFLGVR
jgi:pimeloyl-ACP methyl ester carboxylesterase